MKDMDKRALFNEQIRHKVREIFEICKANEMALVIGVQVHQQGIPEHGSLVTVSTTVNAPNNMLPDFMHQAATALNEGQPIARDIH